MLQVYSFDRVEVFSNVSSVADGIVLYTSFDGFNFVEIGQLTKDRAQYLVSRNILYKDVLTIYSVFDVGCEYRLHSNFKGMRLVMLIQIKENSG